jgi:hypothetical protein
MTSLEIRVAGETFDSAQGETPALPRRVMIVIAASVAI